MKVKKRDKKSNKDNLKYEIYIQINYPYNLRLSSQFEYFFLKGQLENRLYVTDHQLNVCNLYLCTISSSLDHHP